MRRLISLAALLVVLVAAPGAFATTTYPDVTGTNVEFTGIQETSSFGDPEPLFGQPSGTGDELLFFPTTFSATAAGGALDQTGSQLQLEITALVPLDTITTIRIDEFGDTDLSGVGTGATGTFASLSGFLTVLEDTSGPIAPVVIPFSGTFVPTDTFSLPGDSGLTLWMGQAAIDVAGSVPNATKVLLSLDDDLYASSEASPGTTALIQKKNVIISVITSQPAE